MIVEFRKSIAAIIVNQVVYIYNTTQHHVIVDSNKSDDKMIIISTKDSFGNPLDMAQISATNYSSVDVLTTGKLFVSKD